MKKNIAQGSVKAPDKFKIIIKTSGPYIVSGNPPLTQQIIVVDQEGAPCSYKEGNSYDMSKSEVALCRCGASRKKPYCDGAHLSATWDPELTASETPLLDLAETYNGATLDLSDAREFCSFSRFCDAKGRVWNLIEREDRKSREMAIREANNCPSGRLIVWDRQTCKPLEPHYEPSLALIEDPAINCSGPLWVRGGIQIIREMDGFVYEIRNRVTLCRCGKSSNKPYCDGSHASTGFDDGLME